MQEAETRENPALGLEQKTIFQQPFDVNKSKIKNNEEYKFLGSVGKTPPTPDIQVAFKALLLLIVAGIFLQHYPTWANASHQRARERSAPPSLPANDTATGET